jgi:hypothetical protein
MKIKIFLVEILFKDLWLNMKRLMLWNTPIFFQKKIKDEIILFKRIENGL